MRTHRADLAEDLTPSLRPRIERSLARFYEAARNQGPGSPARPRRARGRRCHPDQLPLHARPDHRRLAAAPGRPEERLLNRAQRIACTIADLDGAAQIRRARPPQTLRSTPYNPRLHTWQCPPIFRAARKRLLANGWGCR